MGVSIVGHAVVSADGMIADASRRMPASLRNDADWQRFQAALDDAALVVLGRLGHEAHANPGRRRLVVTGAVAGLECDSRYERAMLWNPAGMTFGDVLAELGIEDGTVAVTGGQRVFDLFLPLFNEFDLVEVAGVTIPDGVPCFSTEPPQQVLAREGMKVTSTQTLDRGVTLTIWRR
jgi:sulfur carrier protein ThiS